MSQRRANSVLDALLRSSAAETTRRIINIAQHPPVPRRQGLAQSTAQACLVVPVYFGTDRALRRSSDPKYRYSNERGELTFGIAEVSIPARHKLGELEGPQWWKARFRDDAGRHVLLLDASQREQRAFTTEVRAALSSADESDLLLFVHGYNTSFADAIRRTAQISYDLKFPGHALLYSWPSAEAPMAYAADEATVEHSIPNFERFLRLVLTRIGARQLHVIAHSMGARALARLLKDFEWSTLPSGSATLCQIVFAAPDIDAGTFRGLASNFRADGDRCTLYASRGDFPLRLSRILHRYPRAGDTGKGLLIVRGVDTVDASQADSSLFGLGHSYFAAKRPILSDMHNLIIKNEPPNRRFDLIPMNHADGAYWLYRA